METRTLTVLRKTVVTLVAALGLFIYAVNAKAGTTDLLGTGGPLDEISKLAAQANGTAASASAVPAVPPSAPVTKFSANGRVTESLDAGGCANNPTITSSLCSPSTNCDAVTVTGPVETTGLGKANLNACLIIILSTSSGACLNGLGIGTLTTGNGSLVNIAFGGDFCLADETLSGPTIYFNSNLSYVIEGGTGKFSSETGDGNLTFSDIIVNPPMTPPFSGSGEVTMIGSLSKN
jgi:hypothetical protein